jgi:hypothetical protein
VLRYGPIELLRSVSLKARDEGRCVQAYRFLIDQKYSWSQGLGYMAGPFHFGLCVREELGVSGITAKPLGGLKIAAMTRITSVHRRAVTTNADRDSWRHFVLPGLVPMDLLPIKQNFSQQMLF